MSIFDFIKDAGEKLFKPGEARHEATIKQHLADNGITGISVEVDGDKATLTGTARDMATREKAVLVAGNINGIARVDDRITVTTTTANAPQATSAGAPAQQAWSSRTYTVKSGDTLSKIAKEMYGDAGKYPQIFEANKPMLKDPDKIYPGQVLRVPPEQ